MSATGDGVYLYDIHFAETTFVARICFSAVMVRTSRLTEFDLVKHYADKFRYADGWTVERVDRKAPGGSWFRGFRWPCPITVDITGSVRPEDYSPRHWP